MLFIKLIFNLKRLGFLYSEQVHVQQNKKRKQEIELVCTQVLLCTHLFLLGRLVCLHWLLPFRRFYYLNKGGTGHVEHAMHVYPDFYLDLGTFPRLLRCHILNEKVSCRTDRGQYQGSLKSKCIARKCCTPEILNLE